MKKIIEKIFLYKAKVVVKKFLDIKYLLKILMCAGLVF